MLGHETQQLGLVRPRQKPHRLRLRLRRLSSFSGAWLGNHAREGTQMGCWKKLVV